MKNKTATSAADKAAQQARQVKKVKIFAPHPGQRSIGTGRMVRVG